MLKTLFAAAATVVVAQCAVPDFYKDVDRIFWVVQDVDRSAAGWKALGVGEADPVQGVKSPVKYRTGTLENRCRWAVGRFGDVTIDLIQPLSNAGAFADFKRRHGDQGVAALVHRVPTRAVLDEEISRMSRLGVNVLERGKVAGSASADYVLFDTEPDGKYVLGLVLYAGSDEVRPKAPPSGRKVAQYAFVAHDLKAVAQYWAKLGFPEMTFTHPRLWDLRYHEGAGAFDALLGWQRHGRVVYEWIQPLKGPTVYEDQMKAHGEGLHHLALDVDDIDRESSEWTRKGFTFVQGGAWGERDKPGYGRFAYHNTQALGGADVELLWNYRP